MIGLGVFLRTDSTCLGFFAEVGLVVLSPAVFALGDRGSVLVCAQ